ncbi:MAG: hypothetical protein NVSMB12_13980 [Acidimicrobiales bacterium]
MTRVPPASSRARVAAPIPDADPLIATVLIAVLPSGDSLPRGTGKRPASGATASPGLTDSLSSGKRHPRWR